MSGLSDIDILEIEDGERERMFGPDFDGDDIAAFVYAAAKADKDDTLSEDDVSRLREGAQQMVDRLKEAENALYEVSEMLKGAGEDSEMIQRIETYFEGNDAL